MSELIDLVTRDGASLDETREKSDVHRDGDWHRASHVWIVTPSGFLLLQRRALFKENFPGLWDVSAAGHLSHGETAKEAAVRETKEELGLDIDASELTQIATTREEWVLNDGTYRDNEIHDVFLVERDVRPDELSLQIEEVDQAVLMHVDTLRRHIENRDPSLVPHWEEYDLLLDEVERRQRAGGATA